MMGDAYGHGLRVHTAQWLPHKGGQRLRQGSLMSGVNQVLPEDQRYPHFPRQAANSARLLGRLDARLDVFPATGYRGLMVSASQLPLRLCERAAGTDGHPFIHAGLLVTGTTIG